MTKLRSEWSHKTKTHRMKYSPRFRTSPPPNSGNYWSGRGTLCDKPTTTLCSGSIKSTSLKVHSNDECEKFATNFQTSKKLVDRPHTSLFHCPSASRRTNRTQRQKPRRTQRPRLQRWFAELESTTRLPFIHVPATGLRA